MPALEKNRIYRAHIDGYSSEGLGIARWCLSTGPSGGRSATFW